MPEPLPAGLPTAHSGVFGDLKDENYQKELEEAREIEQLLTVLLPSAYEVQKNPKLRALHEQMMRLIQTGQERLKTLTDSEANATMYPNSGGEIPVNLVELLSTDKNKLWESASVESFKGKGKYNQASLSDDGKLIITMIKPGVVERIELQVPPEKVVDIRTYIQGNGFKWEKKAGYENEYSGLGGTYIFDRLIYLLDPSQQETLLAIHWLGRHTEPVIAGGPFQIDDKASLIMDTFDSFEKWKGHPGMVIYNDSKILVIQDGVAIIINKSDGAPQIYRSKKSEWNFSHMNRGNCTSYSLELGKNYIKFRYGDYERFFLERDDGTLCYSFNQIPGAGGGCD